MQKNLIIFIGIILFLILIAFGLYFFQGKEETQEQEKEKNILNKEYYSIEVPEGWEETRGVPGISAMIANLNEENADPAVAKIGFKSYFAVAYEGSKERNMQEFIDYSKEQLEQGGTGITITSEEEITIDSREAYLMQGELEQQGAKFKAFIVIIKGNGDDMWFITFNTAFDNWQRYDDLFYEIINSFKILAEREEVKIDVTIIEQGQGQGAEPGDKLSVYYTGELEDGTQFNARTEGEPFVFTLGQGEVIQGWDDGLIGMKKGEKRKLTIPPELGYGEQGMPGAIPGNAVLIFTIELLEIE